MNKLSALIFMVFFSSCMKMNLTEIAPKCDSINTCYRTNIQPIFQQNCYSCHSTAVTQNGGLDLEDTATLRSYLAYGFRGDGIYGSKLYHCVLHSLLALPMPPTTLLDTCSLHQLHHWLGIGAPFN